MIYVGKRILEARVARGLGQPQVADALGITRAAVSAWERGKSLPPLDKVVALAELLQVEPGWLAFGAPVDEVSGLLNRMSERQRAAWIAVGQTMVSESVK